jgi:hypothetical protein
MQTAQSFPLAKRREPGIVWTPVRNSLQVVADAEGKGVAKVSLHLLGEHIELLDGYAAVENALVAHRRKRDERAGKKVYEPRVKWSRKELAEVFLKAQCEDLSSRLEEQVKAIGPLPDADDAKAVDEYAARLDAWLEKKSQR